MIPLVRVILINVINAIISHQTSGTIHPLTMRVECVQAH